MRFMIIVKATKESEAGVMPSAQLLAEMGRFNEQLAKAGVLLAGEGLQPSSKGARVTFSGKKRTVVHGPFAETKELIAGFFLVEMASLEECVEWFKRCPVQSGERTNLEIRRVPQAEDFGESFTTEQQEAVEQRRAQAAAQR